MWDLIVSVPDHCLSFYLTYSDALKCSFFPRAIPVWNAQPASVVSFGSTGEYKSYLDYKIRGMRFSIPVID